MLSVRSGTPAKITGIKVGGFKSAIDPVALTLRDLTVLAGQNSAGKSTVIQPLLLIKQTMEKPFDVGGLAIDGPLVQFTSVDQFLSHSSGDRVKEFFLTLCSDEEYVTMFYKQIADRGITIDRMEFRDAGKDQIWQPNSLLSPKDLGVPPPLLEIFNKSNEKVVISRERAMLVARLGSISGTSPVSVNLGIVASPAGSYVDAVTKLIHLPGLRGNPERNYRVTAVESEYPGNFSEYVASIITGWQNTHDPKLRLLAANLKQLGLTWKVQTRPLDDTRVEILVGRLPSAIRGGARDTISIADVGFGVSQTLPVLVALLAAAPGQLVFIEQPEIHLHPKAQVGLANLLTEAVGRGVRLIVETHSSLLVLALQELIAEGRLDPARVSMNWFTRDVTNGATRVNEATLEVDGSYGEWPADFGTVELDLQARYLNSVDRRAVERNATRH
jgi:putative AbiEii toxin of type IV toxin-antitoxin system